MNAGLLRNFLLNEVEHYKVDIRLTSKVQRTAIGGHIQLSFGFLKIQKADTGDITLVRQRLKHGDGRRACGGIAFQPLDQPFHLILLPHVGVQPGSIRVLMVQLRHFLLHGEIADHPVIFRLYVI